MYSRFSSHVLPLALEPGIVDLGQGDPAANVGTIIVTVYYSVNVALLNCPVHHDTLYCVKQQFSLITKMPYMR